MEASKDDKGETREAREERAPQNLRDRIERADLENLKPTRVEQVLDAPGVYPVVDHRHVDARPDQQPARGKYPEDGQ